ncbi:MAG: hypothetical protein AB7I30_15605 [Isosphaeraceae bacterium]
MRELEGPIGRVWRRLRFQRFLSALVWCWAGTLGVVAVANAAAWLSSQTLPGPTWMPFAISGGLGIVAAALIALVSGPSRVDAAVAIDHAFHLNERLSTALTLPDELKESPAGRALLADAIRKVADLDVRPAFGPRVPRLAWVPLVPGALALGLLFVPEIAQIRANAKVTEPKLDKKLVTEQAKALGKKVASQRQELEKSKFPEADKLLAQVQKAADDLSKAAPEKKERALIELNKLTDALKEREKQLGSPEQVNRQLQQLKDLTTNGPAEQFAKDLKTGNFQKASNELKRLQEKLKSGQLSEADKKALKEQLGDMAKQLEKMANLEERRKQLEEAKKNGGLSQEQYEREMAKLDEQAKSLQKLQKMASQLAQAQEARQKGDTRKAAEALGMTERQVAEMARNFQELEALDAAMADLLDAKNGMTGDSLNMLGEALDGMGNGFGNRRGNGNNASGRGRGAGDRPEAPDQTATYTSKVRQQMGKGKAFAVGTAPSDSPIKGQSFIDVQGEMETAIGNAADALTNQRIPRSFEKHVGDYFKQINAGK